MKRLVLVVLLAVSSHALANDYVYKAGHPSLQEWLLPENVPTPKDNPLTPAKVELGKMLFFDPRLSGDGNMSCASCHSPLFGWSDGQKTARGHKSMVLGRASPVVVNTGYNDIQMWDGREKTLEDQSIGPMRNTAEMNMDIPKLIDFLSKSEYKEHFEEAFPGESIGVEQIAKALASFERTIVSRDSPFDNWVRGDESALTAQQIRGFRLFVDPDKGNCAVCHSAPNFTDNGFHNLGLASFGEDNPDLGRYTQRPLRLMKGAFKTPTIRDITLSAPYFHDGSAETLMEVVEHYAIGGVVKENRSPNMKTLNLSQQEKEDIVAFMESLTTPPEAFVLPILPL
ncbi:cytochrome-c peroxidase [Alteromonas sp. KC3]|uniref:cytochrome-c peroxidase n=1 Tax=unclassified Alteromonas TaxID=2614992 RepID=UPI001923245A|nr:MULTISPECIES: cytochrome c peroxidase [unclassified Alteromonas]BCO19850.1 cytochrome-c peroxidase [Alteromonas sp. KC3]BCO23815.1 cytochrome-c peroxidase [Alteromonas sp. KC14]